MDRFLPLLIHLGLRSSHRPLIESRSMGMVALLGGIFRHAGLRIPLSDHRSSFSAGWRRAVQGLPKSGAPCDLQGF
jgi:hypothetical protein